MDGMLHAYVGCCDRLAKAVEYLTAVLFVLMVLTVCYQVFGRYIFQKPTVWTGDMALFLFIWVVMLGSTVSVYRRRHIAVTLVAAWLPQCTHGAVKIISDIVVIASCLLLAVTAWTFFENNLDAVSSGLVISLGWPTCSLFVGGLLMLVFGIAALCKDLLPEGESA